MKSFVCIVILLFIATQAHCIQNNRYERITDVKSVCSGNRIEILLDEARDVRKVTLRFAVDEKLPRSSSVRVLYWYDQVLGEEWSGEWRYANATVAETTSSVSSRARANSQAIISDGISTGGLVSVSSTSTSQTKSSQTASTENAPMEKRPGPFSDVPSGHWAYEAVRNLVKRGILAGYPTGAFGGKSLMTRFEFAQAVARVTPMLQDAARGRAGANGKVKFEKADLEILTRLTNEFKDELTAIGVDVDAIKRDIAELSRPLTPRTAEITGRPRIVPAVINVIAPFEPREPEVIWTFILLGGLKHSNNEGANDACQESRKLRMIFPCAVPKISGVEVVAAK